MPRVNLTINQVRAMQITTQCMIDKGGKVHFSREIAPNESIILAVTTYNTELTIESAPEQYIMAFKYWVLHKHFLELDNEKSAYYRRLYQEQWAKVSHNRLASHRQQLGDAL